MDHVQTVVVGAGVIGLSIARHLATHGHEVLILEAEAAIGQHTSSRNSQVIHAGIYYPKGSDQHRLCLTGKAMLYDYCATRHVGHQKCGKLTIAPSKDRLDELAALTERGRQNGLEDLVILSQGELSEREPAVAGVAAMLSPSSGIVDAPGLVLSLLGEAEAAGASLALNARLTRVWRGPAGFCLETRDQAYQLSCTNLINAAALGSWDVARAIEGLDPTTIPERNLAKGSYFSIPGKSPFHALIYPMPETGSLGIHSVQDLGGGIRFGPNMDWVDQIDYSVNPALASQFAASIRRYWPDLPDNSLTPDGAGIRPRIWGPGQPKQEFLFQTEADHGMPNLIQLFGFESPGLTSCLAIGRAVGAMLDG